MTSACQKRPICWNFPTQKTAELGHCTPRGVLPVSSGNEKRTRTTYTDYKYADIGFIFGRWFSVSEAGYESLELSTSQISQHTAYREVERNPGRRLMWLRSTAASVFHCAASRGVSQTRTTELSNKNPGTMDRKEWEPIGLERLNSVCVRMDPLGERFHHERLTARHYYGEMTSLKLCCTEKP